MADIFLLIDEYKELLDEKDRLKDATTKNNKILEEKRKELAQAMIDAESPRISLYPRFLSFSMSAWLLTGTAFAPCSFMKSSAISFFSPLGTL